MNCLPLKLANDVYLGHVQFIEEKISGKISWRKRQIAAMLENAMEILSLATQKGIRVYAVKGNWQLNNSSWRWPLPWPQKLSEI